MSLVKINGVVMPSPTTYGVSIMDISSEDSNRNAKGDMCIDRVTTKRKIQLKWDFISIEDMSKALKLVKDVFFEVEFLDPQEGNMITKTMYVGDRETFVAVVIDGIPTWKDVKFNLVER